MSLVAQYFIALRYADSEIDTNFSYICIILYSTNFNRGLTILFYLIHSILFTLHHRFHLPIIKIYKLYKIKRKLKKKKKRSLGKIIFQQIFGT